MKLVSMDKTDLTATQLARLAKKETVVLIRKGKPVAAVTGLSRDDWESMALANDPDFLALLEESWRSYQEQGGIPSAEVRQRLGLNGKRHKG